MAASPPGDGIAARAREIGDRFRSAGRFHRNFVTMKLRLDPFYADVFALAAREPLGEVLDLGCGRGQLGVALLAFGLARRVIGLDWNAAHVEIARRAGEGLAFSALRRNLSHDEALPEADTVVLVDVLYQLQSSAQAMLLARAARAARSRLLVRTADPRRGVRSAFTQALEVVGKRFWPNSGAHVNARPVAEIADRLAALGFDVDVDPCWRGTPFANVLLVARRRAFVQPGSPT